MIAGKSDGAGTAKYASVALFVILLLAVALRLLHWPALHEVRDSDELGYSWGSLQLLEGNLPGIHYAPAGPQTWVGCGYEGIVSLRHLLVPDSEERATPHQLRPFLAVDRTLFEAYRDSGQLRQVWVLVSFICALGGLIGGFRLGLIKAGLPGAVFTGGTLALLPLFVDLSVQARPYIVAWSFGVLALYFALASPHPKASAISAILMGLAIGSRIEMVLLLPVVWSETWGDGRWQSWLRRMLRYHSILVVFFVVIAPWYLMTFVASLRAIGTIRGSTTGLVLTQPVAILLQLIWEQGMLLHVLLFLFAIVLWFIQRPRHWLLAAYILLVVLSVFKGAAFGLRYQGAPLILAIVAGLYAIESLRRYSQASALILSIAALVLPATQSARMVVNFRQDYVPDFATQWIEDHVPPGTIVYIRPWIHNLLPTVEAADSGWSEVSDTSGYKRKFESALKRFGLDSAEIPRALSEVNLSLERANRRFLFILGGRQRVDAPRFDTRVFEAGPAFGVRDVANVFKQTGGVVVLRGPPEDPLVPLLGSTTITWLNRSGAGTRIYCSPEVAAKLR